MRDIGRKSRLFFTTLPFDDSTTALGGPRRNIAITFGVEKTKVVWLPDVENVLGYVWPFRHRDGQTDRHTFCDSIIHAMDSIAR